MNVLDTLAQCAAASTAPIGVAQVTGLTEALAVKQSILSAASSLQLESLQCSLFKAKSGQPLNLSDSNGTVLLGLAPHCRNLPPHS